FKGPVQIGGCNDPGGGLRCACHFGRCVWVEPVPELKGAFPQCCATRCLQFCRNPGLHALYGVHQEVGLPESLGHHTGNNGGRVPPACCRPSEAEHVRDDGG